MTIHILGREIEMKTGVVVAGAAILILVGCLVGYIFFRDTSDIIIEAGAESVKTDIASDSTSKGALRNDPEIEANGVTTEVAAVKEEIKVYVVGCVKKPGIVTLEKGQMIDDAVKLAGGLTEEADEESINMVYKLNENAMLYIKPKSEPEQKTVTGAGTGKSNSSGKSSTTSGSTGAKNTASNGSSGTNGVTAGGNNTNYALGEGAVLIKDGGSSIEIVNANSSGEDSGNNANAKVNINTADSAELDTLPGIGEATARDIISYREKNGPFNKIEDIMKVPRIKQNRFESIQDLICVE